MPVNIGQGPLGLEARWFIAGVTMNDQLADLPRTVFTKITNLHSLPEVEDVSIATRGRIGETPYPIQVRSKTIVIEGHVQAATLGSLRLTVNGYRQAFWDRWTLEPVRSAPRGDYADDGTAESGWLAHGKILDFVVDEEQVFSPWAVPTPWQRNFTLMVKLYDPRWYLYGGEDTQTGSTSVAVNNLGTAPTDPVIVVTGAGGSQEVSRAGGDFLLEFDGLPSGTLTLDFLKREATVGAVDVSAYLNPLTSNWWDEHAAGLPPGASTVVQAGGSGLSVTFNHASF